MLLYNKANKEYNKITLKRNCTNVSALIDSLPPVPDVFKCDKQRQSALHSLTLDTHIEYIWNVFCKLVRMPYQLAISPRLPIVNSSQPQSKFPEKIKAPDECLSNIEKEQKTKLMRVLKRNANISMYEIKLIID